MCADVCWHCFPAQSRRRIFLESFELRFLRWSRSLYDSPLTQESTIKNGNARIAVSWMHKVCETVKEKQS